MNKMTIAGRLYIYIFYSLKYIFAYFNIHFASRICMRLLKYKYRLLSVIEVSDIEVSRMDIGYRLTVPATATTTVTVAATVAITSPAISLQPLVPPPHHHPDLPKHSHHLKSINHIGGQVIEMYWYIIQGYIHRVRS